MFICVCVCVEINAHTLTLTPPSDHSALTSTQHYVETKTVKQHVGTSAATAALKLCTLVEFLPRPIDRSF